MTTELVPLILRIQCAHRTIPMGHSIRLDASLQIEGAEPSSVSDYILLPFVNGRRWGAHERTNPTGKAAFLLPLPNPGPARLQVLALPRNSDHWMGLEPPDLLLAGTRIPASTLTGEGPGVRAIRSNVLDLEVTWRSFAPRPDASTLFCMQWEPWFSGGAPRWGTTQAVPLMGFYDSYNRDVTRQHILWFMDLGVDFILPDWTNHLWGKGRWDERHESVNAIVHATTLFLETLADMRAEGLPVPKVALFPGLSNGRPATIQALNEELAWIYHTYVRNPRFEGLWQEFDGKPLMVVLDTGAVGDKRGTAESAFRIPFFKHTLELSEAELNAFRAAQPPVDENFFTIRWMSSQNETTRHHELGYWSWMDGTLEPPVTYRKGESSGAKPVLSPDHSELDASPQPEAIPVAIPESVTASIACFHALGWTAPSAYGRRGGATYLETFQAALQRRPRVVFLHQFNEFSGQREGHGMGPNGDIYADSYNVEFSDDIEPVSLTAPGYRGDGGWGFYYLNLTQALLAIYRGQSADSTLLAVSNPLAGTKFSSETVKVTWATLGAPVKSFTLAIDGQPVQAGIHGLSAQLSLAGLTPGAHTLTVIAEGATTRYSLSRTELDEVASVSSIPVKVDVPFTKE